MQAIQHGSYGTPEVLSVGEAPMPAPGAHQILIAVEASSVTQGDRRLRAADFPGISWLPGRLMTGLVRPRNAVPGTTFAGRVVQVGSAVTRWSVGDAVFGLAEHGAYAEYLTLAEDGPVAAAPAGLTAAERAALPYGASTAVVFLRDLAQVKRGERVAIVGASGEVGRFAVQVARHLGAEVTAVCSRDQALVRELGAHHVVDYTREDFTAAGARYDVILDTSEGGRFAHSRRALAPRGRYLSLHLSLGLLARMLVTSVLGGQRALFGIAMPSGAMLDDVRALVDAGALRPVVARRFPLARAAEAHAFLEARRPSGSVAIEVA